MKESPQLLTSSVDCVGWGLEETLLVLGTLVMLIALFSVHYFPYVDSTNHLARYVFIARSWAGTAPPEVSFSWIPTGYIGLDAVGAAFATMFSPAATLRIIAIAALFLPAVGLYSLLRVAAPAQRGWALVGLLLAFNWFVFVGFLSYTISIGLALIWLSAWWFRRDHMTWGARFLLGVGAALLYFIHLAALATVLVVLVSDCLLQADRTWKRDSAKRLTSSLLMLGVVLLATIPLWVMMQQAVPGTGSSMGRLEFRTLTQKITNLLSPYYVFSSVQMAMLAGSYAISVVLFLANARPRVFRDTWFMAALALLTAYFVFPVLFLGAFDADVRFLLPAALLVFCAAPARQRTLPRGYLVMAFAFLIVHTGLVTREIRQVDRELKDYRQVLRDIPPGAWVLPLIADYERHGRVDTYRHFVHWRGIDSNTVTPGLFASSPDAKYLAHFRVRSPPYYPHEVWGTRKFFPLDWNRLRSDYRFIVQVGPDPRARELILQGAQERLRRGDAVLYEVR